MKKWIFGLICTIGCTVAGAQNSSQIEQLKNKLLTVTTDTARIRFLNELALVYAPTDSTNAFNYANQSLKLFTSNNQKSGIAGAWLAQGTALEFKSNYKAAIELFTKAAEIYQQTKEEDQYANVLDHLGKVNYHLYKFDEAISLYKQAEKIYRANKNINGLTVVTNDLGVAYADKGNPEKAIEYYLESLRIDEQLNSKHIGITQSNLGKLFFETHNYPEAINYFNKSIQANKAEGDYINEGKAELNMANVYITQVDYGKGIELLTAARSSFEKAGFKRGVQACANNIGALNIRRGKYPEAIVSLQQALELAKEAKSNSGVALIEQNIGYAYTLMKKYPEAMDWFSKAEQTAKIGSDLYTFGEIYNHRSMLDSAMGNYETAFQYRSKYQAINEKLLNEKITKQINELQTKYDTEKKSHQIEILNKDNSIKTLQIANQQFEIDKQLFQITQNKLKLAQAGLTIAQNDLSLKTKSETILKQELTAVQNEKQIGELDKKNKINQLELNNKSLEISRKNTLLFIAVGLFFMGGLLGYSYYKRRQLKQENRMQETLRRQEDLATKAVMEAEENERRRIASDLHDGVGQMMSAAKMNLSAVESDLNTLDEHQKEALRKIQFQIDESCKEIRLISHNMMPNGLLKNGLGAAVREFTNQIDTRVLKVNLYTEGLNERLDSNIEIVLYRVIQECVNNAIKHAKASLLDISFILDKDGIAVTIEDDGKGFNTAGLDKFEGIGLKNIQTRVSYLKGIVEWYSEVGKGTLISIHIPQIPQKIVT
jgi:signal transduction histidine kinase